MKGAGSEIDETVEVPIGESGGQSPIEKVGQSFFFAKGGQGNFEKISADPEHTWLVYIRLINLLKASTFISR